MRDTKLLRNFRFQIKLIRSMQIDSGQSEVGGGITFSMSGGAVLGDGGFQECTGLQVDMDVQELQEGGRNDGVIRQVGRGRYENLVLKRGMFYGGEGGVNRDLWRWLQETVSGIRPVRRYDGVVEVIGEIDDVVATWTFERGLPARIVGPQLNAKNGEIAIEEIHIAHEGLQLEAV